jgi:hypothetical protein
VPAYVGQVFRGAIGIAIACLTIRSGALNLFREEYSYMVYVTLITSVVVSALNCSRLHTAYLQLDGCMEHDSSVLLPAQPEVGVQNVRCPLCRWCFELIAPRRTSNALQRIILWTIETGLVTTCVFLYSYTIWRQHRFLQNMRHSYSRLLGDDAGQWPLGVGVDDLREALLELAARLAQLAGRLPGYALAVCCDVEPWRTVLGAGFDHANIQR